MACSLIKIMDACKDAEVKMRAVFHLMSDSRDLHQALASAFLTRDDSVETCQIVCSESDLENLSATVLKNT